MGAVNDNDDHLFRMVGLISKFQPVSAFTNYFLSPKMMIIR